MPAYNERFHAMAGVAPHKRQCELASFVPARTVVSPPLREAATTLYASEERQCDLKQTTSETCLTNLK